MLPPGANHETYEPTPGDMANLDNACVYFMIGSLDFELNWLPRFTALNKNLLIINTSKGSDLIQDHTGGDKNVVHGIDPHTWLSLSVVKFQANTIAAVLCRCDSINSKFYRHKLELFSAQIDSLDRMIRVNLHACPGKAFMIFHPALTYFARDYGLEQISIEFEGKEPSASRLHELIELAKVKNIKSILVSKEFDIRNAEAIASEIHAKVIIFDPMAEDWLSNMVQLSELIAEN